MTTTAPTRWSHDPVAGSTLRRSVQVVPASIELVMVDRAVGCGRLVTAAAASFAPAPTEQWARFVVLAAVVVLAAGGLAALARPLVTAATGRRVAALFPTVAAVPASATVRLAVSVDVLAALGLVVALGPGSQRVPTTGVLAFCLLPLLEAAVRYGLAGLTAVWLAVVGSLAVATGVAVIGGSSTTVLDALAPLGLLVLLAFPIGLLVLALGAAITRFELAGEAARTRDRLLTELTRLAHDLAALRTVGALVGGGPTAAGTVDASESDGPADAAALLLRCLRRLGFDGVTICDTVGSGLAGEDLGVDEVPRIYAAEELVALGGPAAPPSRPNQPDASAFAAVSRLGAVGPTVVVVGWSVADPLLAARLEAFATAVATYRSTAGLTLSG